MKKRPVIIDCDPGIDDVIALILALGDESLDIRGISTVAGNQSLDLVSNNALNLVEFLARDIPVVKGSKAPLIGELFTAGDVHGDNGLGGIDLPKARGSFKDIKAIDFMAEEIKNSKEKISLIPLGPLTNIAKLILAYPEVKDQIGEIVLMGGGIERGNTTPVAEFNMYVDPEAAKIVVNSGIDITMVSLDLTHKYFIDKKDRDRFLELGNETGQMVYELMLALSAYHIDDGIDGCFLHDPMAVFAFTNPEDIEVLPVRVDVETGGELCRGQTVGNFTKRYNTDPNVNVVMELDKNKFLDRILKSVQAFR